MTGAARDGAVLRHCAGMAGSQGDRGMDMLIWIGAALTLAGVAGLGWSAVLALRARRAQLPDSDLRAQLQRAVTLNLVALFLSVFGLMAVVMGIFLG